jgi:hypothetical protein
LLEKIKNALFAKKNQGYRKSVMHMNSKMLLTIIGKKEKPENFPNTDSWRTLEMINFN